MRVALESPDQPDVLQLIDELDAYQDTLYPPESRHALDLASLKQPRVLFAVARDAAGVALGCAAVVLELPQGELKRLYVRPPARGQGVAQQLVALLESRARIAGCRLLQLETGPRQPEALALYARLGFRRCERFGAYRDDPLSVVMEKALPPGRGEHVVASIEALTTLYPAPKERPLKKQLAALERHSKRFIGLSPFFVIATYGANGAADASPRGGAPGFVRVLDDRTLLVPDAPGNNRLDSLRNIVETGRAGLLFMIPGIDETLRVNGSAWLSRAPAHIAACADEKRAPRLVIALTVDEVYLHCSKAYMRSRLWKADAQVERSVLPTLGEMIRDQSGMEGPLETQEQMIARYAADL
jgi:PPOX class probable FMN-dependent enzyme